MSMKRPPRHRREYPGCVPSLLNIFDIRRRSTTRLLPDRRPSIRSTDDKFHPLSISTGGRLSNGSENGTVAVDFDFEGKEDSDEKEKSVSENGKISVKELMEVEMFSEGGMVNLPHNSQIIAGEITPKAFDNLVYETIAEYLVGISSESSLENDFIKGLDTLSAQAVTITDQKLVAAVKMIMEQKVLCARNYEESPLREEFMDAVNMLTENYSLFVELLQELNSFRLKQALPCLPASEMPHGEPGASATDGYSKQSRSLESFLQGGSEDSQSSLAIWEASSLVKQSLKADVSVSGASLLSFYLHSKAKDERSPSFRFSFTEIKRKLWHALGKDKTMIPPESSDQNRKNSGKRRNLGWSSPNRRHFYSERFILSAKKTRERNLDFKENESDTSRCQRSGEFNIYIEAKQHIYEMLKDVDEDSEPVIKQLPKSLGMILAAPDPSVGEGLETMRPSATQGDDRDVDVKFSERHFAALPYGDNRMLPAQVVEIGDTPESRREEVGEATCESYTSSTDGDFQHVGSGEATCEDAFHQTCLKSDPIEEDQMLSSPQASTSHSPATSEAEGCKLAQPSPVSVLESLFMDEACSPASAASEPEREVEPHHLNYGEQSPACGQGICRRISMETEESPFEYVEAVLLGSGLDWEDFHSRWLSSNEILDTLLFEEVELFSNRSHDDQRLLFDSANEALMGVCDIYFGKESVQPIPDSMDLIDRVWRWIEWHHFLHTQANSMEQLVRMDLARTGKWLKLQRDIEIIGLEIAVTILDEVVEEDTIVIFQEAFVQKTNQGCL